MGVCFCVDDLTDVIYVQWESQRLFFLEEWWIVMYSEIDISFYWRTVQHETLLYFSESRILEITSINFFFPTNIVVQRLGERGIECSRVLTLVVSVFIIHHRLKLIYRRMSNEFWKVHFILNWHIDAILTFDDLDNSRNCQEMFLQIGRSGILHLSRRLVVVRRRWNHIFTITGHFADRCDIYILEVEISTVKSRTRDCFIVVDHCCRKYFHDERFSFRWWHRRLLLSCAICTRKDVVDIILLFQSERTNREILRTNLPMQ